MKIEENKFAPKKIITIFVKNKPIKNKVMTAEQLKRANEITEIITNARSQLDLLSHILNKDEFDFFIKDRCTGKSLGFMNDFLPEDIYKFIGDYSEKVMAEIKKYEEELKIL